MDYTNLIYSGNFSEGTKCWSGSGLVVSNNTATVTGNISHSQKIPVSSNDTYKVSFEIKFNTTIGKSFYIALQPLDSGKNAVHINTTFKTTSTDTVLAKELVNGDTTVEIANATNWHSADPNQCIGICNNLAWQYNRSSYSSQYTSRDGNIITLKNAWTGGSFPKGTKVANFRDSATYFYPIILKDIHSEWKSYSATFKGGDSMRYSCQYFIFSTLGYENNYSIRNIRVENITFLQTCDITGHTPQISKNGNTTGMINEIGRQIRYIKDSINGSTANTGNHWVEIQAINNVGQNCAFNKGVSIPPDTTLEKTLVTDGNTALSTYLGSTSKAIIVDLGFTEQINSIKVWHYWHDGRTYYDHKVEVSADGINWDTVYFGLHKETSEGLEIPLYPNHGSFSKHGFINCNEIIEY